MLGIEHPVVAYALDEACEIYGTKVDGLLAQTKEEKNGKKIKYVPKYTLNKALDIAANPEKQRFSGFRELFLELERTGQNKIIRGGVA